MFTKSITYTNFDGEKVTEDHSFHMSEAEIMEWVTTNGDYSIDMLLNRMVEKKRGRDIIAAVKELIYKSYGERSLDGRRFIKTPEVKAEFMETEAYSALFMELVTDAAKAGEFVQGILPKDMGEKLLKVMEENPDGIPDSVKDYFPMDKK